MSDSATVLDPGRVAHASIRGYLYQAWLGVERWLELREDEVLRCEGDEDLDRLLRDGSGGWSEQVKAYTGKINIRDEVVQETLRRFAVSHHRLRTADPPESRRFVFTSTATRKTQRLDDRLAVDVLAVWDLVERIGRDRTIGVGAGLGGGVGARPALGVEAALLDLRRRRGPSSCNSLRRPQRHDGRSGVPSPRAGRAPSLRPDPPLHLGPLSGSTDEGTGDEILCSALLTPTPE